MPQEDTGLEKPVPPGGTPGPSLEGALPPALRVPRPSSGAEPRPCPLPQHRSSAGDAPLSGCTEPALTLRPARGGLPGAMPEAEGLGELRSFSDCSADTQRAPLPLGVDEAEPVGRELRGRGHPGTVSSPPTPMLPESGELGGGQGGKAETVPSRRAPSCLQTDTAACLPRSRQAGRALGAGLQAPRSHSLPGSPRRQTTQAAASRSSKRFI